MKQAAALLLVLFLASTVSAQEVPLGDQFQVNTYIDDFQEDSVIASDDEGNFVVIWLNDNGPPPWISGQRFHADGTPAGSEFQVNTTIDGDQYQSAVAVAPNGWFLVVYLNWNYGVGAQLYAADGTTIGGEFTANSTPGLATWPDVAVDDQGRYTVVWIYGEVYGRLFNASGIPYDDQFWVPSHDFFGLGHPKIAATPDGQFVVTWHSNGSTGNDDDWYSIQARRFAGLIGIFVDGFESGDTGAWVTH